jgi:Ca-activated chloride channel family protein
VEAIMAGGLAAIQQGSATPEVRNAITQLGLDYNLVTQFTSFIAVEQRTVTDGDGRPKRIDVPVEMPEGVSYEGVFGEPAGRHIAAVTGAQVALSYVRTPGFVSGGVVAGHTGPLHKTLSLPPSKAAPPVIAQESVRPAAPAQDQGKALLALKLHKTLFSIVNKTQQRQSLITAETALIHNGMITVEIQLSRPVTSEKLDALGFKALSPTDQLTVKGMIAVKDLQRLATLDELLFVSPV